MGCGRVVSDGAGARQPAASPGSLISKLVSLPVNMPARQPGSKHVGQLVSRHDNSASKQTKQEPVEPKRSP